MAKRTLIPALMIVAAAAIPAAAATGNDLITTEQVVAAMSHAGMQVSPQQVTLLSEVVASTDAPALKVESMKRWDDHRMMVRLDCASPDQCLPFVVAVRLAQDNEVRPVSAETSRALPAAAPAKSSSTAPTIRAGAAAVLLLDSNRVHIRLSVICLENGVTGQTIRVASKDRRQFYTAEVVSESELRGSL